MKTRNEFIKEQKNIRAQIYYNHKQLNKIDGMPEKWFYYTSKINDLVDDLNDSKNNMEYTEWLQGIKKERY